MDGDVPLPRLQCECVGECCLERHDDRRRAFVAFSTLRLNLSRLLCGPLRGPGDGGTFSLLPVSTEP